MPRYKNKRLKVTNTSEFFDMLERLFNEREKALVTVLYYWGIRISEALSLKPNDVFTDKEKIYLKISRLKGSRQTDDIPINIKSLGIELFLNQVSITNEDNKIFPISRVQAWRICKKLNLYPHFFRLSRFTHIAEDYGLVFLINFGGITAKTANSYIGKSELRDMIIT